VTDNKATPEATPLTPEPGQSLVLANEVYRLLGTYYIYQDQIGWSRIQTIVAVEAGVLAGALSRKGILGPLALVLGTLLLHWLYRLIRRDWQVRDHTAGLLADVNKAYGFDFTPPPTLGVLRGRVVLARLQTGIVAVNLTLALIQTVLFWHLARTPSTALSTILLG